MTEPLTGWINDALLDESVPCDACGRAAQLRSFGHSSTCLGAEGKLPPCHKCVSCWTVWARRILGKIANGGVRCITCRQIFDDLVAFSDYREF